MNPCKKMSEKHECSDHGLALRDFRIEDYDQVIELWRICGLPFRPNGRDGKERIAREIEKPMALFLVIECEGDIVGTLFGTTDGRKGWINRLAVRPDHRRRSIAKRLIKEMETRFERLGLEVFSCLIEDHSESSMRLFEEVGFKEDPSVHYFSKRLNKDS
jgi:ribosomal protein S18 acetylase RimI-like enzyme